MAAPARNLTRRRRPPGWVPDQHGAWAMVTVPVAAGMALAGPTWAHVPLLGLWWVGYFAFYATGLWLRSGRRSRYARPARTYAAACLPLAVATVVTAPHLLRWVPVYLPLVAVTAWASAHRKDRSLLNDAVTVLAAALMTAVVYDVSPGGGVSPTGSLTGWAWAWVVTGVLLAYFWGTVPYVKTMIRERGSVPYLVGSVGYHLLAAGGVLALTAGGHVRWALAVVWLLLVARAATLPELQRRRGRPFRPVVIGVGEIAASLLVLLTLVV